MKTNNIDFISKELNPAAVQKVLEIKTYWALAKWKLKQEPEGLLNDKKLKYRYKRGSSKIKESTVKALMGEVREKVKKRSLMKIKKN
jgi:hypothetical protein